MTTTTTDDLVDYWQGFKTRVQNDLNFVCARPEPELARGALERIECEVQQQRRLLGICPAPDAEEDTDILDDPRFDREIRRWQDAIRDKLISLGAPDHLIDGAGCDSGDPLDFTLAEVGQGVGYFVDELESARATVPRLEDTLVHARNAAAVFADSKYLDTARAGLLKIVSDIDTALASTQEKQ